MDKAEIEYTGERVVPGITPPSVYREHIDRYVFAATLTGDKDVLDVACGTGYGVGYLAEMGAGKVMGVDCSLEAISYAHDWYSVKEKTEFLCADAVRLPFYDGAFDIVVSFETLEHIRAYRKFLAECRRVLRDSGTLVCSTPNRRVFSPNMEKPVNPFHVKEFWPDEFLGLLSKYFNNISLYGQCDVTLADNSVERDRGVHEFSDNKYLSSGYIIAVAQK